MNDRPLVSLSVSDFVAKVADADHPVPAGGSVAALTASSAAALLALVCGVVRHHRPDVLEAELARASQLQQGLLALVDEDAASFHAYLHAKRQGVAVPEATNRISTVPLQMARHSSEILALADAVEPQTSGPMLGDIRAARLLAQAALQTSIELAAQNVSLQPDATARAELKAEISRLRGLPGPSERSG